MISVELRKMYEWEFSNLMSKRVFTMKNSWYTSAPRSYGKVRIKLTLFSGDYETRPSSMIILNPVRSIYRQAWWVRTVYREALVNKREMSVERDYKWSNSFTVKMYAKGVMCTTLPIARL